MAPPVLDPQIQAVLEEHAAAGVQPAGAVSVEDLRTQHERLAAAEWGALDDVHSVEDTDVDGVPIRIYRPVDSDEPSMALVFFHGGGWVIGSIDSYDGPARALAKRTGVVVVSVGYRLAPEHPFPAALTDAWSATEWIVSHAGELNLDADRIGVVGESAGGNLAAVVAAKGRHHAVPVALQVLLYPITNNAFDTPSYSLFSEGYGLTRDGMRWYWQQYLGDGDGTNPDVSPAQLDDLRRLPRAIVVTAEADVLRDEAEAYAQRLFLSTVETEGYRYDGMIHGFLRMAGKVERSNKAYDELAESIRTMLAKGWRD